MRKCVKNNLVTKFYWQYNQQVAIKEGKTKTKIKPTEMIVTLLGDEAEKEHICAGVLWRRKEISSVNDLTYGIIEIKCKDDSK